MMALTEQLVAGAAEQVLGTTRVTYQGTPIDLTPPWRRVTMNDLVKEAMGGFDFEALDVASDPAGALAEAKAAAEAAGGSSGTVKPEAAEEASAAVGAKRKARMALADGLKADEAVLRKHPKAEMAD